MAAATHTLPTLELSAPDDDMDLHTDDGFDFGDGDIELDLDPTPTAHDDDLSIRDAASDGGLDLEAALTDQDDFMVDHGDLIEEDIYDDDAGSVVMQALVDDDAAEIQMLPPPDEDLIDYSDDEGQQSHKIQTPLHQEDIDINYGEDEDLSLLSTAPPDDTQDPIIANHSQNEPQDTQDQTLDDLDTTAEASGDDIQSVTKPESPSHNDHQSDGEDGGVLLAAEEATVDVVEDEDHSLAQDDAQGTHDETQNEHEDSQPSGLQPVTVNYAGSEFWLFKQHDLEGSGDWLLEDLSLVKSSISDLLQACRSSLGDDVSNEQELGFRFDHLNSLELYEDNTACVAVTLERLIDLYHKLQAQDNNTEPESFYVMLQSRPRFATLLSDVAKFADEGRGYTALTNAITAGETHFSNPFSLVPSEHDNPSSEHDYPEWNGEDKREDPDTEDQDKENNDVAQPGEQESEESAIETQQGDEHAGEEHQNADVSNSELERSVDDHEVTNGQPEEVHKAAHEEAHEQTREEAHKKAREEAHEEAQGETHEEAHGELHEEAHGEVYEEIHEEVHEGGQEFESHQLEQEPELQDQPIESTAEQTLHGEHDTNKYDDTVEQAAETNFHQEAPEESTENHNTTDESQSCVSPSFDGRTPEQILQDKQTEADVVDYSDDEGQEDDGAGSVTFTGIYPSSTTIQGGESAGAELGYPTGSPHVHDQNDEVEEGFDQDDEFQDVHDQNDEIEDELELDLDAEQEDGATSGFDQIGTDDGGNHYPDDAQEYEEDDSFPGFEADGAGGDSFEQTFEGGSAQELGSFEYQTLNDELNVDEHGGHNVGEFVAEGEETAGTDDFLDLDNAPEWATDKEPVFGLSEDLVLLQDDVTAHEDEDEDEDEDDMGDLSAVAASPTADPKASSSVALKVSSPQGRKRSIDEVGNGTDDATETTDAKRPRV